VRFYRWESVVLLVILAWYLTVAVIRFYKRKKKGLLPVVGISALENRLDEVGNFQKSAPVSPLSGLSAGSIPAAFDLSPIGFSPTAFSPHDLLTFLSSMTGLDTSDADE